MPPSGQSEMARKSTCCSPSTPRPPGHPQHSQGCELSRLGCGPGPGQCRKEVFTLGLPCCTPAPLCCTPAPRLPSLGCPRPTGSPAAFPCLRPHFLRGMVSLFNLSCPLPNTPPSYLPPDGAAKGALAGRAPFNTRGADSGVAGGGGGGVTRSSALISPGPVSPKTEALRARAVHQRPLDELDAALVCRG